MHGNWWRACKRRISRMLADKGGGHAQSRELLEAFFAHDNEWGALSVITMHGAPISKHFHWSSWVPQGSTGIWAALAGI